LSFLTTDPLLRQTRVSLERLLPRLEAHFESAKKGEWEEFKARLEAHFPRLFSLLLRLYGQHYDFFYHLESIMGMAARMWLSRPSDLKKLDMAREAEPEWFQSQQMLGGVCYVDLFAGTLDGVKGKIPYFKELGLTYLHLMPLFLAPEGESDGGYAVSSYRKVDPRLGTMDDLADLAAELRSNGISLVLDFVFNHTSDEHEWAKRARSGDPEYMGYYFMFPDRTMPDAYERTLREIFPEQRPGSFTLAQMADNGPDASFELRATNEQSPATGFPPERSSQLATEMWVWTTFHSFQWDLNYSNPAVFSSMAEEMLFLANQGAEILRLDALAFTWKKMGTPCENLPEVHVLVQAFNAIARIAAPGLLFKSEAIVHPDEVVKYISAEECQLSYNPLLMALLWEALATREVKLLQHSMRERFKIGVPEGARSCCAWANYVRSHDDIGWTFDDADAARLGINGFYHRQFLNAFYMGRFPGSFARGLPFQENPRTGDARISGTCASLAGLEEALHEGAEEELSIKRILLLYGVALSMGGIPLIYLGDEVGTLNDYGYGEDPVKAEDSRWVHRPRTDWERVKRRNKPASIEGRVYGGLKRLIDARKGCSAFAGSETEIVETGNGHIFGYVRQHGDARVLALANFSGEEQSVTSNLLRLYGLSYTFKDLVSGETRDAEGDITLAPYDLVWLAPR
jgi:glycosidase